MSKKPTRQPSSRKKSNAKADVSASKRETLVSLRAHVDKVEARLKRADTLTRKSVKAIETAFDTLSHTRAGTPESNLETDNAQKSVLEQHVRDLSSQLTKMVEETRASVTEELGRVIHQPSVEKLKAALQMADDRIAETDDRLARSISGINRHIADMALAIDAQLSAQDQAQTQAITDLKSDTEKARYALIQRLDRIEDESANALMSIGEKVASTAKQIKKRSKVEAEKIHDRLSEIEEKSKIDFADFKKDLTERVSDVVADQEQATSQRERGFTSLESRMEGLEFGLNSLMKTVAAANALSPSKPIDLAPLGTVFQKSPLAPIGSAFDAPTETPFSEHTLETTSSDPHSPLFQDAKLHSPDLQSAGLKGDNNIRYFQKESEPKSETRNPPVFIDPLESDKIFGIQENASEDKSNESDSSSASGPFNPYGEKPSPSPLAASARSSATTPVSHPYQSPSHATAFSSSSANAYAYKDDLQDELAPTAYAPEVAPDSAPPYLVHSAAPQEYIAPLNGDAYSDGNYHDAPLPYENPAYADPNYATDGEQGSVGLRPGSFEKKKISPKLSAPKLPALSGRNKKALMMAVGVAAISLVGIKVLSDKTADTQTTAESLATFSEVLAPPALDGMDPSTMGLSIAEPIGEYEDNLAPAISNTSSLDAAAQSGDPVAQFQMGLSYLQSGRKDEAIQLVRASADGGLAAAQYRLAKLYETGEGVVEDPVMARSLTERAARGGNRIAMHDLALYYAEGRGGVETDLVTAAKWFEKAAERGVVDSQFNLGVLYESGQGLPQNLSDAYVWYSIASQQGDQLAAQRIEVLSAQLSASQKDSADSRVAGFKPTRIDNRANGIFKDLPWSKNAESSSTDGNVQKAQNLLKDLGYQAGTPDGAMGPQTRSAIISFERSNGLPETGRVSNELIDRLTLAAGA